MSNTKELRRTEADLLPPGFDHGHVFVFRVGSYEGLAEVDGWNAELREAIEICQSETSGISPKPGQKRKLASDALKLVFLLNQGLIAKGRIYVTCPEMYTWFHQTGSWVSSACRHFGIPVELKRHARKQTRKKLRNIIHKAREEMTS